MIRPIRAILATKSLYFQRGVRRRFFMLPVRRRRHCPSSGGPLYAGLQSDLARQRNEILNSTNDGFEAFGERCRFVYLNRVGPTADRSTALN